MNYKISFLIVNWEGGEILKKCILSIEKSFAFFTTKYVDWKYEIILVDNASKDLDIKWLTSRNFLKLIINESNLKFAKGTNQTVNAASGDYIFVLNNDIYLSENCLIELFEEVKVTGNIAVPILLNPNGSIQKSLRNLPHLEDYLYIISGINKLHPKYDRLELNKFDYNIKQSVEQPFFSALFLKMETWQNVGNMDESFPLLFNDVDWFFRAKNKNITTMFIPTASAYHHHGYSVNKKRFSKVWESTISLRRYFYKNHILNFYKKILLEVICIITFVLRSVKELIIIIINKLS